MSGLVYLASPYSHPEPRVRWERFHRVCRAAARLMLAGEVVFSPIAHSHPIEQAFPEIKDGKFWARQDEPLLLACSRVVVLRLPGWELSKGVAHEIAVAIAMGKPVDYIDPEDY
jgi:nucleoside 2-deoxyribosyltransferase